MCPFSVSLMNYIHRVHVDTSLHAMILTHLTSLLCSSTEQFSTRSKSTDSGKASNCVSWKIMANVDIRTWSWEGKNFDL